MSALIRVHSPVHVPAFLPSAGQRPAVWWGRNGEPWGVSCAHRECMGCALSMQDKGCLLQSCSLDAVAQVVVPILVALDILQGDEREKSLVLSPRQEGLRMVLSCCSTTAEHAASSRSLQRQSRTSQLNSPRPPRAPGLTGPLYRLMVLCWRAAGAAKVGPPLTGVALSSIKVPSPPCQGAQTPHMAAALHHQAIGARPAGARLNRLHTSPSNLAAAPRTARTATSSAACNASRRDLLGVVAGGTILLPLGHGV